jgi:uroporphyrinogen decarboxylase
MAWKRVLAKMFITGRPAISKKDRVFAALEGKVLDRPPCGEIAFPGKSNDSALLEHFIYTLNTDLITFTVDPYNSGFSISFENPSDIKNLAKNTDCFLLGGIPGVFWQAISEMGLETAARMSKKSPLDFRNYMRNLGKRHLEIVLELLEKGADGIMIFDDLAGSKGPFFSPVSYRELVFPELSKLVFEIKSRGKPVFFHSDGHITEFLQDLISMGIDAIHGFEGKTPDEIKDIKEIMADRAAFMGNITLSYNQGEEEAVFDAIKKIQHIFTGGRYIFSSDGSCFPDTINNLIQIYSYFHSFWEE